MIKCPVCGEYEFAKDFDLDVCEVCGWENDGVQLDDPDYRGGANQESLNEYRAIWRKRNKQVTEP
ncbi:MAG: hypothetical protein FWC60_12420 [Firmicutes bacterium]|nr:hypothetical protein [Bacillota bacterium]